jgi:hypothetical protein
MVHSALLVTQTYDIAKFISEITSKNISRISELNKRVILTIKNLL